MTAVEDTAVVLAAYAWEQLGPKIGYHRTKLGTRWTSSSTARVELLALLLEKNDRRVRCTA